MKRLLVLFAATIAMHATAQVGIGTTTPAASAAVEVSSSNKGFLPPRMSWTQIQAIPAPAAGLIAYDIGARGIRMWDGAEWVLLTAREKGLTDAPGSFGALLITGTGSATPRAVKLMPDKSVYVVGDILGSGSFGTFPFSGGNSAFFAKLDSNGVPVLFFRINGSNVLQTTCIDADASGNIYIGGTFFSTANFSTSGPSVTLTSGTGGSDYDGFFAKYDALGNLQWVKQAGGSAGNESVSDLVLDGSYIYVGGTFRGTSSIAGTNVTAVASVGGDAFVGKFLQSTGTVGAGGTGWIAQFGGSQSDEVFDLALYSGGVVAVGSFYSTTNFNGVSRTATGTSADGYYCLLNNTGTTTTVGVIGGSGYDDISAVDVDAAGNFLFGGTFNGTADLNPSLSAANNYTANGSNADAFVTKLNSAQTWQWTTRTNTSGFESIGGLASDAAGAAYAVGTFDGTTAWGSFSRSSQGSNDGFLAKLSSTGVAQWLQSTGGTGGDIGFAVDAQADGKVVYSAFLIQSTSPARFVGLDGRVLSATSKLYIARYEE